MPIFVFLNTGITWSAETDQSKTIWQVFTTSTIPYTYSLCTKNHRKLNHTISQKQSGKFLQPNLRPLLEHNRNFLRIGSLHKEIPANWITRSVKRKENQGRSYYLICDLYYRIHLKFFAHRSLGISKIIYEF